MTLLDAIRASLPTGDRATHLPIRRASWMPGARILWHRDTWQFGTGGSLGVLDTHRMLDVIDGRPQGCLTPESMLADDWEIFQS